MELFHSTGQKSKLHSARYLFVESMARTKTAVVTKTQLSVDMPASGMLQFGADISGRRNHYYYYYFYFYYLYIYIYVFEYISYDFLI